MRSTTIAYILCIFCLAGSISTAETIIGPLSSDVAEPQSVMGVDVDIWVASPMQGIIDATGGGQISFDVVVSEIQSLNGLGISTFITNGNGALTFDHAELHGDLLGVLGEDIKITDISIPGKEMLSAVFLGKSRDINSPDIPGDTAIATFVYNYTNKAHGLYTFELNQSVDQLIGNALSTKTYLAIGDAFNLTFVPTIIPEELDVTTLTFLGDGQGTVTFAAEVPEPTTMALLTMAVAAIAAARRRA